MDCNRLTLWAGTRPDAGKVKVMRKLAPVTLLCAVLLLASQHAVFSEPLNSSENGW